MPIILFAVLGATVMFFVIKPIKNPTKEQHLALCTVLLFMLGFNGLIFCLELNRRAEERENVEKAYSEITVLCDMSEKGALTATESMELVQKIEDYNATIDFAKQDSGKLICYRWHDPAVVEMAPIDIPEALTQYSETDNQ